MATDESSGICARNSGFTIMSNSTARLGSCDSVSLGVSRTPIIIPFSRTSVPSGSPAALSMYVRSSA